MGLACQAFYKLLVSILGCKLLHTYTGIHVPIGSISMLYTVRHLSIHVACMTGTCESYVVSTLMHSDWFTCFSDSKASMDIEIKV